MFSNKEIQLLEKIVKKIDVKELHRRAGVLDKSTAAYEKAAGGKKQLDEAGKVYDERVSAARLEALRITRDAEAIAEFSRQDNEKQREALINSQNSLEMDRGDLLSSRTNHAASMASLKLREDDVEKRETAVALRETTVAKHSANVEAREAATEDRKRRLMAAVE